jgi:hypothetical protein
VTGFDRFGYDASGYSYDGYNRTGFDQDGNRDISGRYNAEGYDAFCFNREGMQWFTFYRITNNIIVSNREISINGCRSASAQLAEPGIEPRTFQLLGRLSIP